MSGAPFTQLVVVGSSAGGIGALSKLVSTQPEDFPAPIVIAQHLDPERESYLQQILANRSTLPVRTISDDEPLEAGVVFVVPANQHINITDSHIGMQGESHGRPKPSVDLLLGSAAEIFGERLVAVILTGTGKDGTDGARMVSEMGGTIVIQNPNTAEYRGMPASLAPNTVDIVVDLDEIVRVLNDLLAGFGWDEEGPPEGEEEELKRLLEELRKVHGVDFGSYKETTILRRIKRRMAATGRGTLGDYRRYLEENPDEYRKPSGSTSWYNRRWFEYTGRNVGESEAYGWLYAVHPDDREASLQAFLDAVDGGSPERLEHRIRGVDGRYRWFLVQARPLLDDGRVVRWFGAATDVHEQRTALEALGESEKRYRSLAEATSSIVSTGDENGAVVEEMPSWEAFTGQTYREYQGFGWLEALHPEDRPPENLWEKLSAPDPAPMEGKYRLRSREGEYRRIVLRGVPILGERGETREWVGTIFDVEDTRRVEEEREELRREAERERTRLETILQQMPGGVFIADASGRFVLANEGGERVYGTKIGSIEECVENSLSYPDGEELPPDAWPLIRALKGEAVSGMEYYVVRPDGTRRIIRANSAPVRDGRGNVVAAVKAFEDVTRRKEVERERDRSRERERDAREAAKEAERRLAFYAGAREERQLISRELHDRVAHSIAVVRQNLELYEVLRERNPEAASKKMELAKQEAKASLKSTRDLSMMLRRSEVEEGLARSLEGLKETTIPLGVGYESTVTGDESLVPPHIGNQIFLILREAVRNAVNHSGCGSVAVQLQITKERVIGTVEDDGQGFELDGAHAGGGLRSMKERASLVGGAFRLRSVSEGGAKIEVTVPLPGDDS